MADTNTNAADFAASIAAAASAVEEQGGDGFPTEADSGSETDESSTDDLDGERELSAGESSADDDADEDDEDGGEAGDGSDEDSDLSGESVDSIRELFLTGDKDAALKALGLDPKVLDVNGAKLKAMREGLKESKELAAQAKACEETANQKLAQAEAVIRDGKARYGQLVDLRLALKAGDYTAAKDLLEAMAPEGTTYKEIAEGIAKAAQGMSPSEQLYRRKLREMAAREAAEQEKPKEPAKTEPAALAQKNLDGAKKLLANTALVDIPGAAEKLVELAAKNWDPVKKGLKVPREELVKQLQKDPAIAGLLELKQLKAKGKKPPATPPAAEQPASRNRDRRPVRRDPAQKEKDEFAAAMAEATRMEAASRRRTNTGKGRR